MIPLNVPGPVPSFLEVYEMVRSRLREEGMPDSNFTIEDTHGRIVGLQEVQQGGDFRVVPGSNIHTNPAMPYEFTDFYSPVVDQRGNNYPELLPENITPHMVNDMIEQYGLFNAICNLISVSNTPRTSMTGRTTAASIALMRSRLVEPNDVHPGAVLNNPVDRIASPTQIIAGKEQVFSASIDRRLKEYFAEEGYSIHPMVETHGDGSPENQFRTTYSMSNNDQFFDNHRLPSRYQTSQELFFRFCHTVLSPYLVSEASAEQFIKHLQQEVVPSLQRDIGESTSRASRAAREREMSQQVRYMLERVATDPKDFYYGREMAMMVHPVFLVPHMRFVILPAADQERETFQHSRRLMGARSNRNTYITRAERLLREGGSPPSYVSGARVLPDYSDAEGGGNFVVMPLHHQFAVGPGTTPFSWQFVGDRLRNFDIPGLLRALFTVQEQRDVTGQTTHSPELYVEAARRLFSMSRAAREDMFVRNSQGAVNNRAFSYTRPEGAARYRQTGELMRPPQLGPYSQQELEATNGSKVIYTVNDLRNILSNMGGTLPQGRAARTRAPLINAIIQYQQNNGINPLGPLDYDRSLITVVTETPILYEIDLPGLHPLPIGWPEPMVFSMMEMLAKYKDHITGLNGSSYDPSEFLSPKINSHFRIDDQMEIDITYYDTGIGRNRRFSLSYDQLREVAEMDPSTTKMSKVAEYAMRLNALFAQMQGLDNDPDTQESLEMLQRIMSSMSVLTKESDFNKVSDEYTNVDALDYEAAHGHDFGVLDGAFTTLRTAAAMETTKGQIFPETGNNKNAAPSAGANISQDQLTLVRAMIVKHLAMTYLPDFMRVAHQNGAAIFNLDVDVSDGLSSLFILREIIKHSKSAYNYTPSDDDVTFTYTLMVWCLENCLGQGQQREEQESLEGFVGRMFNTVFNRNEERNEQIAAEVMNLIQAGNIDPAVEEALIEWMLEDMGA